MSRVLIALIVGAALGAAVFLFLRSDAAQPAAPAPVVAAPAAVAAAPSPGSRAFGSPTHPGLVVTVTRGGATEAQTRVQLSRSSRSLVTSELAWEPAGSELTDAAGRAEFPALSGRYLVVATARDGTRAVESVDVSRAAEPTWLTIALKPPALFGGQVVDEASRRPLPGAIVRADPQPEAKDLELTLAVGSGVTDSLGRFGLELPDRRWRIEARAPGYLANAEAAEKPTKDLVIALTKGVEVSGVVVDPTGQPVSAATLRIAPGDTAALATDSAGRFAFTAPHAPISLHALAPDGRQGLARLLLAEKQETAQVRLVVGEGGELAGLVRDGQGPVLHADVRVLAEPESLEVAAFDTPLDGRFAAKGLPPGRYSVRAQQGLGRRATVVGLELPGAGPVELVLSSAGRVIGTVRGVEGQPSEGANVTLEWPSGLKEVPRTARTGPDGRFEFDDLLSSAVFLQARLDDLVSEEIENYVAPGATAEVNLVITPQGRLVGTVADPTVNRVLIRGQHPAGEAAQVVDQRFEKLLAPGSYRLFAQVGTRFVISGGGTLAEVRAGEITRVAVEVARETDGGLHHNLMMRAEPGMGLSFENSPGGVRVDFLTSDCPAAQAGIRIGDLVLAIDGQATLDAADAFARVRKPSGSTLDILVRRDGQDLKLTVR
ncbi:MAG: PDZ domain-containing protein [Archangium sp.]|nr:PDZ domain-containing protein [Archangium sp.]